MQNLGRDRFLCADVGCAGVAHGTASGSHRTPDLLSARPLKTARDPEIAPTVTSIGAQWEGESP